MLLSGREDGVEKLENGGADGKKRRFGMREGKQR